MYIKQALSRAEFYFGRDGVVGYSIKIFKHTRYEYAKTLRERCSRIITWCNKQVEGSAEMVWYPTETRYDSQFAVITIYDPVMIGLEKYIKSAQR